MALLNRKHVTVRFILKLLKGFQVQEIMDSVEPVAVMYYQLHVPPAANSVVVSSIKKNYKFEFKLNEIN